MLKPLLVGEAPGPGASYTFGGERFALFPSPRGSAGHNLYRLSGLRLRQDYLNAFERINLMPAFGPWRKQDARECWQTRVLPLLGERPSAVLFGARVNEASGLSIPVLGHAIVGKTRVFNLPHPSGRNLWYNDLDNYEAARVVLLRAREAPWLTAAL